MKKTLYVLVATFLLAASVFAVEPGDEYIDDYTYDQNGQGDQFIKFDISGCFPILSDDENSTLFHGGSSGTKLKPGFSFDLGYYRFLTKKFAVGGEVSFSSNWSIGDKLLTVIPFTGGVLFQPSVGKFEFPMILNIGIAYESWANFRYFPGLAVKAEAGAYFRINDSWSVGLSSNYMWVPQWTKDYPPVNGMFVTANLGGRFHF